MGKRVPFAPEAAAKPVGFILLDDDERGDFENLSKQQQGYFLHWLRSNPNYTVDWWRKGLRKAREQRP